MLKLYESAPGTDVMSLRTGSPVATIVKPLINPHNLYIEGWFVNDNRSKKNLFLLSNDVRDVLPQGFVINDFEVLSDPDELIRLKEVLAIEFDLVGLRVSSESGRNYGKVSDYAFETSNMFVQKIYASQALVKSFHSSNLSIDRSQIIEVTNKRIVIEDPTEKRRAPATSPSIAS